MHSISHILGTDKVFLPKHALESDFRSNPWFTNFKNANLKYLILV